MSRLPRSRIGEPPAGSQPPTSRVLLIAALIGCGVLLLLQPIDRGAPHTAVLTSSTQFTLTGSASNLTPGVPASLGVTVKNPFSVPLTLISVTATVSPTPAVPVVPPNCAGTNLSLVEGQTVSPFVGATPTATLTFTPPQPVLPASSSSPVASLSIMLARSAGNNCQNVVFPLNYTAVAVGAPPPPSTTAAPTTATQPAQAPTTIAPATTTAPAPQPSSPLPVTGGQIAELVFGALALLVAGTLIISLIRRRTKDPAP